MNNPCSVRLQKWPPYLLPLVSVSCITYNHEAFIERALDSILDQITSFPIEILVHDDASTDNTQEIILRYQKRFPHVIKPLLQNENRFSQGVRVTRVFQNSRIKGKYLATCEGDDYWCDPTKLQQQVDFLEENPSASFVFHNSFVLDEVNKTIRLFSGDAVSKWYTRRNLISGNFISTPSKLTRVTAIDRELELPIGVPGDWIDHFMEASSGDFFYMPQVMSTYRIHPNGRWSSRGRPYQLEYSLRTLYYFRDKTAGQFENEISSATNTLLLELAGCLSQIIGRQQLKEILHRIQSIGTLLLVWGFNEYVRTLCEFLKTCGHTDFVIVDGGSDVPEGLTCYNTDQLLEMHIHGRLSILIAKESRLKAIDFIMSSDLCPLDNLYLVSEDFFKDFSD